MKWIKCPYGSHIRCYEKDFSDCPLDDEKWMDEVDRFALTGRSPRASDWTTISSGRSNPDGKKVHWFKKTRYEWDVEVIQSGKCRNSNIRDPKPMQNSAVRKADMYVTFDNPDAVIGWVVAGENNRAKITKEICDDLKRGAKKGKEKKKDDNKESDVENGEAELLRVHGWTTGD